MTRAAALPGDPRFFARTGPHALAAVVAAAAGDAVAEGEVLLHGIAPLQAATPETVSFLDNRRYVDALKATQAGAVLVHPALASLVPAGTIAIRPSPTSPGRGWPRCSIPHHRHGRAFTPPPWSIPARWWTQRRRSGRWPWWRRGPRSAHVAASGRFR